MTSLNHADIVHNAITLLLANGESTIIAVEFVNKQPVHMCVRCRLLMNMCPSTKV
jgi:hypothetical protein